MPKKVNKNIFSQDHPHFAPVAGLTLMAVFVGFGMFLQYSFSSFTKNSRVNSEMQILRQDVPFLPQAPYQEWDDPRQEDGCEEASVIMAMAWVHKTLISSDEGRNLIIAISEFEKKHYGVFRDTSAYDTAQLFPDFFSYKKIEVVRGITANDIINELKNDRIVIVPVNGQKLVNPFFTPPGPVEHMIVVTGFDFESDEFITNDPGTKNGYNFRYSRLDLENAIQDYQTGYHEANNEPQKNMIVVSR